MSGTGWAVMLFSGVLIGALWGAFLGFVARWLTRDRRYFASRKQLVAARYEVVVERSHAAQAARLLTEAYEAAGHRKPPGRAAPTARHTTNHPTS